MQVVPTQNLGFFPPFFWHNSHRTLCFYAIYVRGLTLPFFEERDPESTPTAVKKGEVRRFQFLHCDMFTFVFRHLFFVCVFGKDGMECDEFLIFYQDVERRFFFKEEEMIYHAHFRYGKFPTQIFGFEEKLPISL